LSEHLYIHIPFCVRKCGYCDFYSTDTLEVVPEFASALKQEIRIRAALETPCAGFPVTTLYFGGGTPSLVSLKDLAAILDVLKDVYPISPCAEITLEVNPGTVDFDYFAGLRRLGVNRLSLGIQSFNPEKLKFLGRIHTVDQGKSAIAQARDAGFDNIGLDLIYGGPGETTRDLRLELETALAFQPEHLSCYMLTLEPGTPLYAQGLAGAFTPMASSAKADLFSVTSATLGRAGFSHYEISNFARGAHWVSRHNRAYWQMTPYTGFGPSAHSLEKDSEGNRRPVRAWNVSNLALYMSSLDQGQLPVAEQESLSPAQQMAEAVMVGLRTREGIDLARFNRLSEEPFLHRFSDLIHGLGAGDLGHVSDCGRYFALTLDGWNRLDNIVESFAEQIL